MQRNARKVTNAYLGLARAPGDRERYLTAYFFQAYDMPSWEDTKDVLPAATLVDEIALALMEDQGPRLPLVVTEALARVHRLPHAIRTPPHDFLAFLAFCIGEVARVGDRPTICPSCLTPWFGSGQSKYCLRPAIGRNEICRYFVKHQRFREQHRDYHRERKKIFARVERGTLARERYKAWLTANGPGGYGSSWVRFDDWKTGERPREGRQ